MKFSIKINKEDLIKYLLYFGFEYNLKTDLPEYYTYERDDLTIMIVIINRTDEPLFNLAIWENNIRKASLYEDEAFNFLNDFFESERRKLTISNLLSK